MESKIINNIETSISIESTPENEVNQSSSEIKTVVREKYGKIATQTKIQNEQSLCGIGKEGSGCCQFDYTIFSEDYTKLEGYCKTADLGLGCGIPTACITIKPGNTVVDLGCGAGNDCFVARAFVGETGKVIGLDFTPIMLRKAWENLDNTEFKNVEFRFGDIEDMPIKNEIVDVVISNCVINLIPDKKKVFSEIRRILKPNGFFSISDVVLSSELPDKLKNCEDLYAGCVSGAALKDEYISTIQKAGFICEVKKEKEVLIPDEILQKYLNKEEIDNFKEKCKIYSITLIGIKPAVVGDLNSPKEKVEEPIKNDSMANKKKGCCKGKKCC